MKPVAIVAVLVALAAAAAALPSETWSTSREAPPRAGSDAPAAAEAPRDRVLRLAQTYSSKCVTPTTICFVDPAPLGNPCSCGSSQGRIQR